MLPETGDAGVPVKGWFSSPLSFFVASSAFFSLPKRQPGTGR